VSTKDHVLVARHESDITGTTDIAQHPEFGSRRTTKVIDGASKTGWFTEDFTLAELRTLRAVERMPDLRPDNAAYDGRYAIPTFDEVLVLAQREGVGVYPETKHPTYFRSLGLPLEEPLLAALEAAGWDGPAAPVFVQSFEEGNLRALRRRTGVRLVQLTRGSGRPADLGEVAAYADAIGPDKSQIVPRDASGRLAAPTSLVDDAHRAGLAVHPYTFRPESAFLPSGMDSAAELALFYGLGVDGVFADHPDIAVAVRRGGR
jgi:glycerophosphoryl diester phosphodiesterase